MHRTAFRLLLVVLLCVPATVYAQQKSFGCLDEQELAVWKTQLGAKQRRLLASDRELYGASLAQLERSLARSEQGDEYARRYVAQSWTMCQLFWGDLAPAKLERALRYHETGDMAGSRFNAPVLAIFHGMGWGTPRDVPKAVGLLMQGQQMTDLDGFAEEEGLIAATPDERGRAFLLRHLLESALQPRLGRDWPLYARREASEVAVPVTLQACPLRADVDTPVGSAIDAGKLVALLQQRLRDYPTDGLPCRDDDGDPYRMRLVFTVGAPEYSPFERE